jgi:hypothetical protein
MLFKTIIGIAAAFILAGCVAYATPYGTEVQVAEPVVAVGFYDPLYGYWTGYGWDVNYYAYGHPGYGHPFYHGPRYVRGGHAVRAEHHR